jgi:hypothetical protein
MATSMPSSSPSPSPSPSLASYRAYRYRYRADASAQSAINYHHDWRRLLIKTVGFVAIIAFLVAIASLTTWMPRHQQHHVSITERQPLVSIEAGVGQQQQQQQVGDDSHMVVRKHALRNDTLAHSTVLKHNGVGSDSVSVVKRVVDNDESDDGCDNFPDTNQCEYVQSGSCDTGGKFNYLEFYYCTLGHVKWLCIIIFVCRHVPLNCVAATSKRSQGCHTLVDMLVVDLPCGVVLHARCMC